MRRREFLGAIGAVAVWHAAARAQNGGRSKLIGVLMTSFAEADPEGQARLTAFRETFQNAGWVHGQNCRIVIRWAAGDLARMARFAKELSALKPDVMVVMATPALIAMQRLARPIPIVFVQISDPVGGGFAATMARPGGNMTGFANFEPLMGGKWLELLKEVAPHVTRVAVLVAPTAVNQAMWKSAQASVAFAGVKVTALEVHNSTEIEHAITAFGAQENGGLIVLPDPIFNAVRASIVKLAAHYRLPTIYPFSFYARAGGLVSYGIDQIEQFRGAARYVDRILRGEKAGELPVQAPSKYELTINLNTAKALGLSISQSLLFTADRVIE